MSKDKVKGMSPEQQQVALATQLAGVIKRWAKKIRWIGEVAVSESIFVCWPNGGSLHSAGWPYPLGSIYNLADAKVRAAIVRSFCRSIGRECSSDEKAFFGELVDVAASVPEPFFIATYDDTTAVVCQ